LPKSFGTSSARTTVTKAKTAKRRDFILFLEPRSSPTVAHNLPAATRSITQTSQAVLNPCRSGTNGFPAEPVIAVAPYRAGRADSCLRCVKRRRTCAGRRRTCGDACRMAFAFCLTCQRLETSVWPRFAPFIHASAPRKTGMERFAQNDFGSTENAQATQTFLGRTR
jgi:hypothetical protein